MLTRAQTCPTGTESVPGAESSRQCTRQNTRVTAVLGNDLMGSTDGIPERFIIDPEERPDLYCLPFPNDLLIWDAERDAAEIAACPPGSCLPGTVQIDRLTGEPRRSDRTCERPEVRDAARLVVAATAAYTNQRRSLLALPSLPSVYANNKTGAQARNRTWSTNETWSSNETRAARRLSEGDADKAGLPVPDYLSEPPIVTTFKLPAFTTARLRFDLRGLQNVGAAVAADMKYNEHFRIAIFVEGQRYKVPYPPSFWFDPDTTYYPELARDVGTAREVDHRWNKQSQFNLHLHSMRLLNFRVELQILHGLYTDMVSQFVGAMRMDMFPAYGLNKNEGCYMDNAPDYGSFCSWGPDYGGDRGYPPDAAEWANALLSGDIGAIPLRRVFICAVKDDDALSLPFNMPRLLPNKQHYKYQNTAQMHEQVAIFMSKQKCMDPMWEPIPIEDRPDPAINWQWESDPSGEYCGGGINAGNFIDGTHVLEYSMVNYTKFGILMDPFEGPYAEYSATEYWSQPRLEVAPMQNLPFFSLCSRGIGIGRDPSGFWKDREPGVHSTAGWEMAQPEKGINFGADDYQQLPFRIGYPHLLGGTPDRPRGTRVLCLCPDIHLEAVYVDVCPPPEHDVSTGLCDGEILPEGDPAAGANAHNLNLGGEVNGKFYFGDPGRGTMQQMTEILFTRVIFDGAEGQMQQHLGGDGTQVYMNMAG